MTSHGSHNMDSMDSQSSGGHTGMIMTFFTSTSTPLYATSWTPGSTGAYAGSCIFLIVLAVIFRGLLASKSWLEARWLDRELARRYVRVEGQGRLRDVLGRRAEGDGYVDEEGEGPAREKEKSPWTLSNRGVEEDVLVVQRPGGQGLQRAWRVSVDPARALLDTLIAGVGYLL